MRIVLGPFEPVQDWNWQEAQFLPVGGGPGPKKIFCLWWNIFNGVLLPSQYQSVNWSLGCILGHFEADQRICFCRNWPYVYILFWPNLPYFCYYWLILTLKHQKCTYSIISDAKMAEKSKKIGRTLIWNLGCKKGPKTQNYQFWHKHGFWGSKMARTHLIGYN